VAATVALEALEKNDFTSRLLGNYERELRRRLDGRHQGYLAAQQWFRFKHFANFLIDKAARVPAVHGIARQILCGERDLADVFSLRGIFQIILMR
jgi:hypothetical protein